MKSCGRKLFMQINQIVNSFILFTATVKPVVTCIKGSPYSCPVIENFKWIEPLLRGHLSYMTTSSLSWRWPLNTGLSEVDVEWSIWHMILIRLRLSIAVWPLFALWIFTCWLTCLNTCSLTCLITCSLTCFINCEFTC